MLELYHMQPPSKQTEELWMRRNLGIQYVHVNHRASGQEYFIGTCEISKQISCKTILYILFSLSLSSALCRKAKRHSGRCAVGADTQQRPWVDDLLSHLGQFSAFNHIPRGKYTLGISSVTLTGSSAVCCLVGENKWFWSKNQWAENRSIYFNLQRRTFNVYASLFTNIYMYTK